MQTQWLANKYYKLTKAIFIFELYQLQDLIGTLHVMDQFKHFLYRMKGENLRISMVQQTLKKIKMLQFYMKIEWIYKNLKQIYHIFFIHIC